jgi:hypothetical protein
MSKCGFCGAAIEQSGRGRPRRYCSASHRQMAYDRRRLERLLLQQKARLFEQFGSRVAPGREPILTSPLPPRP